MTTTLRVFALAVSVMFLCLAAWAGDKPQTPPAQTVKTTEPAEFTSLIKPLSEARMAAMRGVSWHPGCPVELQDLRLLRLSHWDFDGAVRQGELIVHREIAEEVVDIFRDIFQAAFPVASMRPVADFGGDDDASMAANNSSAFNCRRVTGGKRFSRHAYGMAVDINPVQNPWVKGDKVLPPAGRAYLKREASVKGLIVRESPVVTAFLRRGWAWGGRWRSVKDYQHFERKN